MAKKAQPWYWEARNSWYVIVNGQRHALGDHPAHAPPPKKGKRGWNSPPEIDDAYRRLLATGTPKAQPQGGETVIAILDDFISWCKEHRAARTAERYEDFCQEFVTAEVDGVTLGKLDVGLLSSKHVTRWLAEKPSWNATTKKNAITALSRGFNWAVKNRGLARNPIKGIEKPQAKKRVGIVTPEEFEQLLAAVKDQPFRDLLVVSYDSGARPFEVKELERRHLQADKSRAVIPADEAKGRKRPRTVYFPTDRSMEVVTRLIGQHPEGPIFLNRRGRKWTGMAVKCRLEDLDHVLGRRVRHYDLRHSRITDWLVSGVDSHVVAKLSGHQDSLMIDTTYSHVQEDYGWMLDQAKKRTTPATDS